MATSKKSVASVLVLVCAAATFSASAPVPLVEDSKQASLPWLPIIPPVFGGLGGGADPEIVRCVKSLLDAKDCVNGILESARSGKMNITKGCCLAIDSMSEHCFSTIFPVPRFGSVFLGLVKSFCAAAVPAISPPSA